VNDVPHNDEPSDDIDDLYRRAAALDPSRPSERVRDAVLSHAAQLAAERPSDETQATAAPALSTAPTASTLSAAQRRPWYRAPRFVPNRLSTVVGTLAAAVLVGLLVIPRFLLTPEATLHSEPPVQIVSIPPTVARQTEAPKVEEIQPYISRPQERAAAAARARTQAGKDAQTDLNSASTQTNKVFAAPMPSAPAPAPVPPAASAPLAAPTTPAAPATLAASAASADAVAQTAYTSVTTSAIAQPRSLTLPAAPDSPVSGAAFRRAAERGDIPKLRSMLDLGVDVNACDADDRSALLLAVRNNRKEIVEFLLAHGANVNAADRSGTTPLQAAESSHQTAIAATLRSAGAH
jgi:hypothetical protein